MLLTKITSRVLGTHCYLVATSSGGDAIIVDPGVDVDGAVAAAVSRDGLNVRAVFLTHGHIDHSYDAARVSSHYDVPCLVGVGDLDRFDDPIRDLGPGFDEAFMAMVGWDYAWSRPSQIVPVDCADADLDVATLLGPAFQGYMFRAAPGHTPGSTILCVREAEIAGSVFTGDVLFAGSIGRCDLRGGDEAAMAATLQSVFSDLPDTLLIHSGHGPESTLAVERRTNPYLR